MSTDIKLTDGHDVQIMNGDLVIVDGAARVAQQIKVTLLTFLAEYFLDVTFGVPYVESVLVKNPDRPELEWMFRQKIMSVPGVSSIKKIDLKYDSIKRDLFLSFEANTQDGVVADSITLGEVNAVRRR